MDSEINLIRKAYCMKRGITDPKTVGFVHHRVNPKTGNHLFLVNAPARVPELYEHVRFDVSCYNNLKQLNLPKAYQSDRATLTNKAVMADWVNRQVNLELRPEDIGPLAVQNRQVTLVMAADSMRFRNSFTILFS